MAGIVPLLLNTIYEHLTRVMQTEVAADDPTRVDVVKIGRFQGNPVTNNVHLAISPGDPDKLEWIDGIVTLESMQNIGFIIDPREVGGGQVWWRRGIIEIECFFIREKFTQIEALGHAYTVMSRLQHNVENIDVSLCVDEFGEQAVKMFLYGHNFSESGGPPKSYIWRGKVYWQCLTEIP